MFNLDLVSDGEEVKEIQATQFGKILHVDSMDFLRSLDDSCVDLVFTSPPYDILTQKKYGNKQGQVYQDWMLEFGKEFYRVLKETGSLVIDLGGGWTQGAPTKNLYEYRLLLNFVDEIGFHLAQDFFWWDPSRLPTPAQWVNIERVRAKDAVNKVWWLSKSAKPKADNRRVLQEYSKAMELTLLKGTNTGKRASGHDVSEKFHINNGGSIPPNLIAVSNSISQDSYSEFCKEHGFITHPARIHSLIPEFFIRMLTDDGDSVIDPFAGSCVTGAVAERLLRNWVCCDTNEEYLLGALGRFINLESDGEKLDKRRDYVITAPNFARHKRPKNVPLALQSQFNLFENEGD